MRKEFGAENLETLFENTAQKPPMTLRVNVRKTTVEKWLADAQAAGCPARALGGQAVLLEKARPVNRIPGFAEGTCECAGRRRAVGWPVSAPPLWRAHP